jgi:hypothetical protein
MHLLCCYRLTPGRSTWKEREPRGKAAGADIKRHGRKATICSGSRAAIGFREGTKINVRGVPQRYRCKCIVQRGHQNLTAPCADLCTFSAISTRQTTSTKTLDDSVERSSQRGYRSLSQIDILPRLGDATACGLGPSRNSTDSVASLQLDLGSAQQHIQLRPGSLYHGRATIRSA